MRSVPLEAVSGFAERSTIGQARPAWLKSTRPATSCGGTSFATIGSTSAGKIVRTGCATHLALFWISARVHVEAAPPKVLMRVPRSDMPMNDVVIVGAARRGCIPAGSLPARVTM